jgi:type IV secretory pathway VirB10-like protein
MSETVTDEQMAPDASPGELTRRSGVRRVNNLPVYIIGGVMAAFLLVMALVAMDRAEKSQTASAAGKDKGGNSSMFAKELVGDRKDGVTAAATPPTVPTLPNGMPQAAGDLDAPPRPPQSQQANLQPPRDPEIDRIRMAKQQQFEQSVKAKTSVQVAAPRSGGNGGFSGADTGSERDDLLVRMQQARRQAAALAGDDPTAAYKTRLAQLQAAGLGGGAGGGGDTGGGTSAPQLLQTASLGGGRNNLDAFGKRGTGDRWPLDLAPEAPRTPYELRAGFVVPATLISGVNSELPGQIIAQVAQPVFDTPTGKYLLVPQGSRLVGSYSSEVAYGQSRLFIAWQRIIFPDGKAMDIGAMPGADSAGYAGFIDQVNNHYLRLFGSAFLMSGVTAAITLSQDRNTSTINGSQTASGALRESLGQQLGQVTAQLIAKNLNTAPTLEIRPGYRFNVMVIKDMTFSKPYKAFDY